MPTNLATVGSSVIGNRPVLDVFDGLIDHEPRDKKPLAWDHRVSKPILDIDIEARWLEDAMDEIYGASRSTATRPDG